MGLSASQARFLQLTARKSNVEYQAQQINFQRLQWSNKLSQASSEYQDKTSNMKLTFSFNDGTGTQKVDITYTNYKNYMNQQLGSTGISTEKYYLVSSTGNKIIVGSEEERDDMWQKNLKTYKPAVNDEADDATDDTVVEVLETAGEDDEDQEQPVEQIDNGSTASSTSNKSSTVTVGDKQIPSEDIISVNSETGEITYQEHPFKKTDFMIVDNLNDVDLFQNAIKNGTYYFATLGENSETGEPKMQTESWETLGAGKILEEYDTADDAAAEAEFKATEDKIQLIDKKLELQLSKLETEREAIQTEIDSVSKVIEDNVESSFKVFS